MLRHRNARCFFHSQMKILALACFFGFFPVKGEISMQWDSERGYSYPHPQDIMVDSVNYIGILLLRVHNRNNENNIALSPYGATSVLVALGEGVQGSALDEIVRATLLPVDVTITRVGLRDIQRHLKSYFIPQEGFLAGLTFSHENVTLKPSYERILRFYGYDVDLFNSALNPELSTSTTTTTTQAQEINTSTPVFTVDEKISTTISNTTELPPGSGNVSPTEPETVSIKIEESSTLTSSTSETIIELVTTTKADETLISTTQTIGKVDGTTISSETADGTTEIPSPEQVNTTHSLTSSDISNSIDGTKEISTIADEDINTITTRVSQSVYATTEILKTTEETNNNDVSTLDNSSVSEDTTESIVTTLKSEEITETVPKDVRRKRNTLQKEVPYKYDGKTHRNGRNTRSTIDYLIARYYDHSNPPTIHTTALDYEPERPTTFSVNGKTREPNINFMTYDTVLPFRYIAYLNALALTFPLDSTKYYLLLVLPVDETGIDRLVDNLMSTTLKQIIYDLQPTRVKATIPSFMLKGYVVLTPTLQKMGIRQIFEPRHSDFSKMTEDKNIYVTNIEQAVTVTIKNYVDANNTPPNEPHFRRRGPVHFTADHPFLYFVMDAEIHVALMAGKIINPLNSRIR